MAHCTGMRHRAARHQNLASERRATLRVRLFTEGQCAFCNKILHCHRWIALLSCSGTPLHQLMQGITAGRLQLNMRWQMCRPCWSGW